jgi:hypothetical protein
MDYEIIVNIRVTPVTTLPVKVTAALAGIDDVLVYDFFDRGKGVTAFW